jgi:hypothetical protein
MLAHVVPRFPQPNLHENVHHQQLCRGNELRPEVNVDAEAEPACGLLVDGGGERLY